ncbi:MAG: MaoC family dehydratase [Verrucomicrobiota bacterium]|nr:MaoC family dehydratase [Verrucomicrobiota bacterium]
MSELFFEDLSVGQSFESAPYAVSEKAIVEFAREFDVQAFHLSAAAAEQSLFGGLAASGWHTAAIAMRLFTTTVRFSGGCIGLAVDDLRWPIAVRPNDTIVLQTEIVKLRTSKSKPQHGIIRIRNVARNQHGAVVLSYEADALVSRRPNE